MFMYATNSITANRNPSERTKVQNVNAERRLIMPCLLCCPSIYFCLCLSLILSDKPEVKIVVEFPQGLTREGENLELTCQAKGKPQYDTHTHTHTRFCQLKCAMGRKASLPAYTCTFMYPSTYLDCIP